MNGMHWKYKHSFCLKEASELNRTTSSITFTIYYAFIWSVYLDHKPTTCLFICSLLIFCTEYLYVFCCIYCILMAYSLMYVEINSKLYQTMIYILYNFHKTKKWTRIYMYSNYLFTMLMHNNIVTISAKCSFIYQLSCWI